MPPFARLLLPILFLQMAQAAPEKQTIDGVTYHILRAPAESVHIQSASSTERRL